jgi:hypothetical protein
MGSHFNQTKYAHLREDGANGIATHYRLAKCDNCGEVEKVRDARMTALPDEGIARILRLGGWTVGRKDYCPTCSAPDAQPKKLEPEAPKAKPAEKVVAIKATPSGQPRPPSMAERRTVLEALEERYDIDAGRYRQQWSDASLAQTLNLPRAWIEDIRKGFFGEGDTNEAALQRDAEAARLEADIEVLRQMLTDLESQFRLFLRKEGAA